MKSFTAALGEMIHRLGDQHSTFFSPENARKMDMEFAGTAGYAGIGVVHTPLPERGKLAVILFFRAARLSWPASARTTASGCGWSTHLR